MSSTIEIAKANELDRGDNNMTTIEDDVYEKENIGIRSSVSGKSITDDDSNDTSNDLRRNIPTVKISPDDLVISGINDNSQARSPVDRAMLKIAVGTASPSSLKENKTRREQQHGITGPLSPTVHLNLANLANNGRKKKKNQAAWSNKNNPVRRSKQEREEQRQEVYPHMLLRSSNPSDEEDNNKDIDDDDDVDENKTDKKDTLYSNTSQNLDLSLIHI